MLPHVGHGQSPGLPTPGGRLVITGGGGRGAGAGMGAGAGAGAGAGGKGAAPPALPLAGPMLLLCCVSGSLPLPTLPPPLPNAPP